MNWMDWPKRQLAQFAQETKTNQRLRWGLFAIGVLALLYITLVLDDLQENLLTDHGELSLQKTELITLEPEAVWQQRVSHEKRSLEEQEIVVWQAASEALARANLQSSINGYAESAGLQVINLQVGSFQPHAELAGVSLVRLEVSGAYADDDVLDFIGALESSAPMLRIVRTTLTTGRRRNRATMMILAYFTPEPNSGS